MKGEQKDSKADIKPWNFINLPYYNNGASNRYAVDKNNSKLSLEQFIEFVNASKINKERLDKLVEETGANLIVASVQKSIDEGKVVEETGFNASRNGLQTVTLLDAIENKLNTIDNRLYNLNKWIIYTTYY